jgi:hypothetical protein
MTCLSLADSDVNNAAMSEMARRADRDADESTTFSNTVTTRWGWNRVDASVSRTEKDSTEGESDNCVGEIWCQYIVADVYLRPTASSLDHTCVTTLSILLNKSVDLRSVKKGAIRVIKSRAAV